MDYFLIPADSADRLYPYEGAASILRAFHAIQWNDKPYEEFMRDLRRRLRRYTGRSEVSFMADEKIADLLIQIGEVRFDTGAPSKEAKK